MLFQQQQQDVTKSFVSCTSHSCIMVQSEQQVPRVPLGRTGMRVSVLGMGCSPLGHSYGVTPFAQSNTPEPAGYVQHSMLQICSQQCVHREQ